MITRHKGDMFSIDIPNGISILTGKAGMEAINEEIKDKADAMETNRFEIELIDLKYQKVLKGKGIVELREKTLRYKAFTLSEKPIDSEDLSLGTEESKDEWDCFVRKDQVVAVDLILMTPKDFDEYWCVSISIIGRYDDLNIYFKYEEKSRAIKFQKAVLTWLLGEEY